MAHYIPSMMALAPKTQELFDRLPTEFTKKQYEALRDELSEGRYPTLSAISLVTAREYGIIEVVRTEKTTYTKEVHVYINPTTNEKLTEDELDDIWCKKLAREFGLRYDGFVPSWSQMRAFSGYANKEFEGIRNVFGVNWNKFHDLMDGKRKF
jgi:hypothetical protein